MQAGFIFLALVLLIAGALGLKQVFRDAKTSTDKETGSWATIGIFLILIGGGLLWVLLSKS